MHSRFNRALIVALACCCGLAACSKENALAADAPMPANAETAGPTNDPCALVTDKEVRKVFAGAKAAKRDHSLDKYDIATCSWDTPTNTFVAQIFKAKGSADDEARSRTSGSVDPVNPGAGKNVRYESVAGVGDAATVVVERGDAAQGILSDVAVIAVRKGDRMAVLFSRSLIDDDRDATVKAMEALARSAAGRL